MLERCWSDAGAMLEWCWNDAGTMLESCWNDADTMLAPCWNAAARMLAQRCNDAGTMLGRLERRWDDADAGAMQERCCSCHLKIVFASTYSHVCSLDRQDSALRRRSSNMWTGKTLLSVGGGDGGPIPASKQGCSKRGSKRVDLLWTFVAEATTVVTCPLANGAKRIACTCTTLTEAARWQTTQAARGQLWFACLNMELPHGHSEGTPQENVVDTCLSFRFQNAGWNRLARNTFDEPANDLWYQVHRSTVVCTVAAEKLRPKEL